MAMMHLSSKSEAPGPNELGLQRLRRICDYANKLGIVLAFENTKIKGYQEYVMDHIKDENIGICFDVGHCHAHFKDDFDYDRFNNRFKCIHLHDNFAEKDEHLLPFDGNINWIEVIKKLKDNGYQGSVTLEIVYHRQYVEQMSVQEFYKKAYQRGLKLKNLFETL